MFWTVAIICTAGMVGYCDLPAKEFSPAFSFYATKEACEHSLALNDDPNNKLKLFCIASEAVTFDPAFGFAPPSIGRPKNEK